MLYETQLTKNKVIISNKDYDRLYSLIEKNPGDIADLLEAELNRARIVSDDKLPADVIAMGSTAVFKRRDSSDITRVNRRGQSSTPPVHSPGTRPLLLAGRQSLVQIGDNVIDRFNTHTDANHFRLDAGGHLLFFSELTMGGGGRMTAKLTHSTLSWALRCLATARALSQ